MISGQPRTIVLPGYDVRIAPGALDQVAACAARCTSAHRYVIVSDDIVAPLYAQRLRAAFGARAELVTIPSGEEHKTRETWGAVTDRLLALGAGRDSAIIALGGGVVGDLAGFVAATYMRGVPYVQVPTTLLAMVDAAIGGKTGVDTPAGKNLVGAFHRPAAVIIDPTTLATLPVHHRRNGAAEAIKHGVIADAEYFERVCTFLPTLDTLDGREPELIALIARSVEIKAEVVREDEREQGGGRRRILNFGHTLAHAIERETRYAIAHGQAVAIGMVIEARLGEALGVTERGTSERIAGAVRSAGLADALPAGLDPLAVVRATREDKKARAGRVEYALPARVGAMASGAGGWSVPVSDDDVLAALGTPLARSGRDPSHG
ncbi:MAG TPA: 3-dehydroquinate synthase [Gemmatimonadaceae bacterium]|nr:3-dehydroquinate synthase [Gemmatimonadaceae bacterium]